MTGLIIATSVIGALLVATIVVGAIKYRKMEQNLSRFGTCLLAHITDPSQIEILEDYDVSQHDFNFPNTEGGF